MTPELDRIKKLLDAGAVMVPKNPPPKKVDELKGIERKAIARFTSPPAKPSPVLDRKAP